MLAVPSSSRRARRAPPELLSGWNHRGCADGLRTVCRRPGGDLCAGAEALELQVQLVEPDVALHQLQPMLRASLRGMGLQLRQSQRLCPQLRLELRQTGGACASLVQLPPDAGERRLAFAELGIERRAVSGPCPIRFGLDLGPTGRVVD